MQNGLKLYERIGRKQTYAHKYNRLPDDVRAKISFDDFKRFEHNYELESKYYRKQLKKLMKGKEINLDI